MAQRHAIEEVAQTLPEIQGRQLFDHITSITVASIIVTILRSLGRFRKSREKGGDTYDNSSEESGETHTTGRLHGHVRPGCRPSWHGRADRLDRPFEFPEFAGRSGGTENQRRQFLGAHCRGAGWK